MLVCHTPGGPHERFFEEVGEEVRDRRRSRASERPEGLARTVEIAAEYGIEMPPPMKQTRAKESR